MGKRLWVERNKDGSWDAFSDDGAHIKFGKDRGQFTPGDLMKVALAGCAALSSQFAIEHTLGEGKGAKIVVDGTYDPENDAYTGFEEQVVIDASDAGLSEEDADKLKERVTRHIDKGCTVKHTYVQETPVRMNVTVKHWGNTARPGEGTAAAPRPFPRPSWRRPVAGPVASGV